MKTLNTSCSKYYTLKPELCSSCKGENGYNTMKKGKVFECELCSTKRAIKMFKTNTFINA